MQSLPFDIELSETGFPVDDIPIRFKHSKEDREILYVERTYIEMLNIIDDADLWKLVLTALYNNDFNFSFFETSVKVKKIKGGKFVISDNRIGEFDFDGAEVSEDIYDWYKKKCLKTWIADCGGEVNVIFSQEGGSSFVNDSVGISPAVEMFLTYSGTNTLHKLGKVINRAYEIHKEYCEKYI